MPGTPNKNDPLLLLPWLFISSIINDLGPGFPNQNNWVENGIENFLVYPLPSFNTSTQEVYKRKVGYTAAWWAILATGCHILLILTHYSAGGNETERKQLCFLELVLLFSRVFLSIIPLKNKHLSFTAEVKHFKHAFGLCATARNTD